MSIIDVIEPSSVPKHDASILFNSMLTGSGSTILNVSFFSQPKLSYTKEYTLQLIN